MTPARAQAPRQEHLARNLRLIIDLGSLGRLGQPQMLHGGPDALMHKLLQPSAPVQSDILPSFDLGSLHATLRGKVGAKRHLGTYQLDTRFFMNSRISGSIDEHGARVTITVPMS